MNELQAILQSFTEAEAAGKRTALASVISVEGSAYRRAGAHMLIHEDGQTVGTISAGCLEADVIERSRSLIESEKSFVAAYDTRGNEDMVWGLGLGCNGVVRVLIESLRDQNARAAMHFTRDCLQEQRRGVVARILRTESSTGTLTAARDYLMFSENRLNQNVDFSSEPFLIEIWEDAKLALRHKRSMTRAYQDVNFEVFFDVIEPPRRVVIIGAEQDAQPVAHQAKLIGWKVTLVDIKARTATRERFSQADEIILCRPQDLGEHLTLYEDSAAVVMTHNFLADVEILKTLLSARVSYLGMLGPKARTDRVISEIRQYDGYFAADQFRRLHAPIGIDIGAETPEEIALAIISEIRAVDAGRVGGHLCARDIPIHDEQFELPAVIGDSQIEHSRRQAVLSDAVCAA